MSKKLTPFTYEDRETFRDKWIRLNVAGKDHLFKKIGFIPVEENRITSIAKQGISITLGQTVAAISYKEACDHFEFLDGKPFGKEDSLIIAKN